MYEFSDGAALGWGMRTGRLVAKIELSSEVAGILESYMTRVIHRSLGVSHVLLHKLIL